VDVSPGGAIIAVVDALPSAEDLRFLEKQLNRSIELRLTTRGELSFALRRGYERLRRDTEEARLGQDLLEQGLISSDQLNRALRLQRQRYRKLGDILLSQGAINESQLDIREGMATPSGAPLPLGEALIKKGIISRQQLDKALEEQRRLMPRLGDLLVQSGAIDRAALEAVVKNSRRTF
jgi:adsorption protein B